MHSFIPLPLTRIPYLVDIHHLPLIGIGDTDTFVTQLADRGSNVTSSQTTVRRPIDPKL